MFDLCNRGHEYTPENTYWRPGGQKRECIICRRTERRSSKESKAAYKVRSAYGITVEQAAELKSKGCEICGTIEERICIDHCHDTNKVRGGLCYRCNLILGMADDNIDTITGCLLYLLKHDAY